MEGRTFVYQNGHIFIKNDQGVDVQFQSLNDFNTYYSGKIDLSQEYYIDYEPDKKLLYYNKDPKDFTPLANRYDGLIQEYDAIIADVQNMADKLEDPYFGMTVNQAREHKLAAIKMTTYRTITQHMPEWRQIQYNEYIRIHEKKKSGQDLGETEAGTYLRFSKKAKSHAACYKQCKTALEWITACIDANDERENDLAKARSFKAVKHIDAPDYPPFPA